MDQFNHFLEEQAGVAQRSFIFKGTDSMLPTSTPILKNTLLAPPPFLNL